MDNTGLLGHGRRTTVGVAPWQLSPILGLVLGNPLGVNQRADWVTGWLLTSADWLAATGAEEATGCPALSPSATSNLLPC